MSLVTKCTAESNLKITVECSFPEKTEGEPAMAPKSTAETLLLEDESLRDGLQMESRIFSLDEKLHLFNLLKTAGIPRIEVGSFVHNSRVPQMADTDEFIRAIGTQTDVIVSALVLNDKGLERALNCGVPQVSMSVSVSDTHSRRNAGRPAAEALASMTRLIGDTLAAGLGVRGSLQCVFGCVYEGAVPEKTVLNAAEQMARTGISEICLSDTTGMATPAGIRNITRMVQRELPGLRISLHLHDTRGLGLVNLFAGYEVGVRAFDVCAGGLGGCPFVRGAAGNVAAEDAVNLFESMGIPTGIDLVKLCEVVAYLETLLGRQLPGRMKRVLDFQQRCS